MEDFKGEDSNVRAAIDWASKYEMWIQAYALTEEYVISKVLGHDTVIEQMPGNLHESKWRRFVSAILALQDGTIKGDGADGLLRKFNREATEISNTDIVKEIRPFYRPLSKIRNALAHGSGEIKYGRLGADLESWREGCFKVIDNYC